MPRSLKNRKLPDGRIEKPEDKDWKQWFEKLDTSDHDEYLHKLGLDEEEIKELETDFDNLKKGKKKSLEEILELDENASEATESKEPAQEE